MHDHYSRARHARGALGARGRAGVRVGVRVRASLTPNLPLSLPLTLTQVRAAAATTPHGVTLPDSCFRASLLALLPTACAALRLGLGQGYGYG